MRTKSQNQQFFIKYCKVPKLNLIYTTPRRIKKARSRDIHMINDRKKDSYKTKDSRASFICTYYIKLAFVSPLQEKVEQYIEFKLTWRLIKDRVKRDVLKILLNLLS